MCASWTNLEELQFKGTNIQYNAPTGHNKIPKWLLSSTFIPRRVFAEPSADLAQLIGNAETESGPRQRWYLNSVVFIAAKQQGGFVPAVAFYCIMFLKKDFPVYNVYI